jgi:3-deoxy-D-manno-octulosonic-acid transferase
MRWIINILYLLGLLIGSPWFIFKMITAGKYRRGLAQRMGRLPFTPDGRPLIWLHGVSVGELQLSKPLIAAIESAYPGHQIVISHTTRTGEDVAAQNYPHLNRFYFPLDFSWVVAGVMRRLRPKLIILVELELWPNFLTTAKRMNVPVLLANGRISARSAAGYGRNAWFFRKPFAALTLAGVQNEEYAARMRELFSQMDLDQSRIRLAGNIKFDAVPVGRDEAARQRWRGMFGLGDDELLLVCGSTHPGEHVHLPACYQEWRKAGAHIRMLVVPRHPERWDAVRVAFREAGVGLVDRSSLSESSPLIPAAGDGLPPCILLDKMGELGSVYHAADIVFVGGSLIPHGGQNMIEPAGLGLPVIYGPHTANFKAVVRELREANAAIEVQDIAGLVAAVKALVAGPDRRAELGHAAREVITAGRGSIARHMELVREVLGK